MLLHQFIYILYGNNSKQCRCKYTSTVICNQDTFHTSTIAQFCKQAQAILDSDHDTVRYADVQIKVKQIQTSHY